MIQTLNKKCNRLIGDEQEGEPDGEQSSSTPHENKLQRGVELKPVLFAIKDMKEENAELRSKLLEAIEDVKRYQVSITRIVTSGLEGNSNLTKFVDNKKVTRLPELGEAQFIHTRAY